MRTSTFRVRFSVASLVLFVAAAGAAGQANPLDPAPAKAGGNPFEGGNVAANPVAPGAEQPLKVPDFIKPGARLVYKFGSKRGTDDAPQYSTVVMGMSAYDVVAVTGSRVYCSAGNYMDDGRGGQAFLGSTGSITRQADVVGAGALWMPKDILAQLAGGPQHKVEPTAHVGLDGRRYEADALTWQSGNAISRTTWDRGTGLLLVKQSANGRGVEFERSNNDLVQFVSYRALKLPWAGAEPPAWSRTVRRMVYRGSDAQPMPGFGDLVGALERVVEFTAREGDVTLGRWTTTQSYPNQAPVSESGEFAMGPGGVGEAFWISPQALAAMRPGVIDEDPSLGTQLSYDRQQTPMGEVGYLRLSNANRTTRQIHGYRLSDGALVYAEFVKPGVGQTRTLQLVGIE